MSFVRWLIIAALIYLAHLAGKQDQSTDCAIFIVGAFIVLAIDSAVDSLKKEDS